MGTASLADKSCAGHPSTSVNPDNKAKTNVLIRADRRITLDELASEPGVNHGSAHNIVESEPGVSHVSTHNIVESEPGVSHGSAHNNVESEPGVSHGSAHNIVESEPGVSHDSAHNIVKLAWSKPW